MRPVIYCFGDYNKLLKFDVVENRWYVEVLDNPNNIEFKSYACAVSLPNTTVLITGGGPSTDVIVYDKGQLSMKSPLRRAR